MRTRRIAICLAASAAALVTACTDKIGPEDPRPCASIIFEWGNSGCLEVIGHVVGLRGQPLARVYVNARATHDPATTFVGSGAITDSTGAFAVRVARMAPTATDTLSVWVIAGVPAPTRTVDSSLVVATFSPVGAIPTPTAVTLTLPVP